MVMVDGAFRHRSAISANRRPSSAAGASRMARAVDPRGTSSACPIYNGRFWEADYHKDGNAWR